jgi:superfamily II DNA or RNA helicase
VLLVADECHRYGAGQWRRILHSLYRRRLGLTATFERNDDGIEVLLTYFGGGSVYTIGFARAIADRVVAPYDVKLLGVRLTRAEQSRYKEADQTVKDCRVQLLAAGFPAEPFGAFMHEVQEAAKDDQDPTITEVARRYLKAFSERIEITACADAKLDAL